MAAILTAGGGLGPCAAACTLLAAIGRDAIELHFAYPGGQDLVHTQVSGVKPMEKTKNWIKPGKTRFQTFHWDEVSTTSNALHSGHPVAALVIADALWKADKIQVSPAVRHTLP